MQMLSVLFALMLMTALLTVVVGSIGLTGAMGMNVLKRTREIRVMRAIGAVDSAVKSVVIEGAFIGLLSCAISLPFSSPISGLLLTIVNTSMGIAAVPAAFAVQGMVTWSGLVLGLAALASTWTALNAARQTMREVLAYELTTALGRGQAHKPLPL